MLAYLMSLEYKRASQTDGFGQCYNVLLLFLLSLWLVGFMSFYIVILSISTNRLSDDLTVKAYSWNIRLGLPQNHQRSSTRLSHHVNSWPVETELREDVYDFVLRSASDFLSQSMFSIDTKPNLVLSTFACLVENNRAEVLNILC